MFQLTDVENLVKTRRALMIVSLLTLVFANLTIVSEKFSFFGIEVLISQKSIVLAGQAATLYLSMVFLLQALPEFIKMFGWMWDARINSLERVAWSNYRNDWGFNEGDYEEHSGGPDGDAQVIKWQFERLRTKKHSWLEVASLTSIMTANFFVSYVSPIVAASLCLLWPELLGWLLN